jgi:hypothetical protein
MLKKFDICESLLEKFNFYCKMVHKNARKLFQDPDIGHLSSVQDVELSVNFFLQCTFMMTFAYCS